MDSFLSIQDNLLQAPAKELLRTDEIHMMDTERFEHTEYLPDSLVLVHYRTGLPPTRLHMIGFPSYFSHYEPSRHSLF